MPAACAPDHVTLRAIGNDPIGPLAILAFDAEFYAP